jgi:molybdopterin-guanine dinucleotide biosynthesis protein A
VSELARAQHALGRGPVREPSRSAGEDHAGAAAGTRGEVCGVVLCGGLSERMGRDKAGLELGGRTLLERTVERLERRCPRVVLACGREPRYAELGRELVLDLPAAGERPGPIAGILAALEGVAAARYLVLACDLPRAGDDLLAALLERAEATGADAVFFESARGLEPLCAVYAPTCAAPMRAALSAGQRRVLAFLDHPREDGRPVLAERLSERELDPELRARDLALNLNTPEELERERTLWREENRP